MLCTKCGKASAAGVLFPEGQCDNLRAVKLAEALKAVMPQFAQAFMWSGLRVFLHVASHSGFLMRTNSQVFKDGKPSACLGGCASSRGGRVVDYFNKEIVTNVLPQMISEPNLLCSCHWRWAK